MKKIIYIIAAIWTALWIGFTARELFVKNNLRDYKELLSRSLEGKRSYVTGERLYEFLEFCREKLPEGAAFRLAGVNKASIDRVRSIYYLYPHSERSDAEYILVYDYSGASGPGRSIFARLDDKRYILQERTAE